MTIEELSTKLKLFLPDWITCDPDIGIKIHYKDSEDADPIKSPWIYMDDMAITIEKDGLFKILDFHNDRILYFPEAKKLLDYLRGVYDAIGLITKEKDTKEYAQGILKTVNDAIKFEFEYN
jgi:hypothetical protein